MRRFWAVPCALAGVLLLASGVLAGLLFLFWAAVIAWPDLAFVTWPRHAENPPRSLRVPRLLAWPLAAIPLCVLVISLGTIGYFLLGEGSLPGLVVAAIVAVVSVQVLYRLEPRSAAPPAD